ncbi:hypothetical protein T05_1136 [Trichinella murrelli]|uniref:Uncharacterized protein n=1 Tax=Trichinella murrelli TaxID=144512 RepID=A0A0V0TSE6_9BILA|nr:hypothetical protein T05_1136 [Trichinella murrelli]
MVRFRCIHSVTRRKTKIKLLSSQSWVKVTPPDYVVVYVHAFGTFEGPWSGSAASIASRGKKRTIKLLSSQSRVKVTLPDYVVVYVHAFGTFEGPWSGSAASIASRGKKRTIKLLSSQSRVKVTLPDYVVVYVHAFGTFEGPWVPTDGGTGNPWKSDSAYHTYNIVVQEILLAVLVLPFLRPGRCPSYPRGARRSKCAATVAQCCGVVCMISSAYPDFPPLNLEYSRHHQLAGTGTYGIPINQLHLLSQRRTVPSGSALQYEYDLREDGLYRLCV